MTQSVKALRCTILVVSRTLTHSWTGAVSDINAVIFFYKIVHEDMTDSRANKMILMLLNNLIQLTREH